ncbi:MAG: response regulator transcription factor [Saprospirales bacterium]|nr:response regulator transcription factor [Saprospirales bacterium]
MIKAVLVEDELKGMNNLKNQLAKYCEDIEVIGEATNIQEAQDLFDDPNFQPDVALLDINLPDGLVFSLLNELRPIDFDIIFVTAFNEFAIKACEYSSIGYIMKPIDPEALQAAVKRIRPRGENRIDSKLDVFNHVYNNPNAFEKMSISALDGMYFVNLRDIVRFEAEDNYTHIFLKSGDKITASKTIKAYEEMLQGLNFYRVHKRHVINLNYMRKFVKGDGGYLVMDDGKKIDVSRRRRPSFMEQMRRLQEVL